MAQDRRRVVVVGTGLGGLLTGAFLARRRHSVTFVEAQSLIGGRFTHIDHQGFAVPTGAFHAFPGGVRGHLFHCLCKVGVHVPLIEPAPSVHVATEGQLLPLHLDMTRSQSSELRKRVGVYRRGRVIRSSLSMLVGGLMGRDIPAAEGMRRIGGTEAGVRLLDHLTKFSLSVPAEEASAVELLRSIRSQRFGRDGFLVHGSGDMVAKLRAASESRGATFHTAAPVRRIVVEGGRARGVEIEGGEFLEADWVVANAGARRTLEMLGDAAPEDMIDRVGRLRSACGFTHAIRSRRRMHEHSSIEITLDLEHIAGIMPVSNLSPFLCPEGWHFSLAYQWLDPERDAQAQLEAGRSELRSHLGDDVDLMNTASYYGRHPTANIAQMIGQHGRDRPPARIPGIDGLYLVGHDVRGYGTAAELVGESCLRLWRTLEKV
jgi:phytoene dehydrogenase-like protein